MNEVQIMQHDEDNFMNPNKLFNIYEQGYKCSYVGADSKNGERLHIINLFPKESAEFIRINIAVNAKKNQLETITIYDKNGGIFKYIVKSFKTNTALKPFIFNIKEFPNVEVIDLR
jgi:outer membrane lipoprotein-sorting protein